MPPAHKIVLRLPVDTNAQAVRDAVAATLAPLHVRAVLAYFEAGKVKCVGLHWGEAAFAESTSSQTLAFVCVSNRHVRLSTRVRAPAGAMAPSCRRARVWTSACPRTR
jgi:hypothetical protein